MVGIFDPNDSGTRYFAHELRMNLWAKHLSLPATSLHDPTASVVHWRKISKGAQILHYDPNAKTDPTPSKRLWIVDVGPILLRNVAWNFVLDPDGS